MGPTSGADELAGGAEDEDSEPEEEVQIRKAKPKRGAPGLESSVFHGKSLTDYQGRTYMSPPVAEAPQLQQEPGSQETFIPKTCIHTWTGHTQGVSVIRLFPNTGHLMLSGSMDTKIKVSSDLAKVCVHRSHLFCPVSCGMSTHTATVCARSTAI